MSNIVVYNAIIYKHWDKYWESGTIKGNGGVKGNMSHCHCEDCGFNPRAFRTERAMGNTAIYKYYLSLMK